MRTLFLFSEVLHAEKVYVLKYFVRANSTEWDFAIIPIHALNVFACDSGFFFFFSITKKCDGGIVDVKKWKIIHRRVISIYIQKVAHSSSFSEHVLCVYWSTSTSTFKLKNVR